MLGNAADLSKVLDWYGGFWDEDDNGDDLWPNEIIEGVSIAALNLVNAFDCVEGAHHKEFLLTGAKKSQKV
jgi:hypothetical protein